MVKQVPKSDAVKALVAKVTGDPEPNLDTMAIYEAVFANTLPLRRQNGIYAGAQIGADVLANAAERLNAGETVPLALMHRSGLPAGRVLSANMRPGANGSTELVGMFMLPKTDSALISKIDSGVINEVSVNFLPAKLLCSDCGFDYLGDEATFDNLWDCKCANDHTVGKNGNNVRIHGLKAWSELSLVDRGAVDGAKILPRSQQTDPARLAARGFDERAVTLFASASIDVPELETPDMDTAALLAASANDKAELIVSKRDVEALTASIGTKDAEIVALKAELATSVAKVAELSATDATKLKDAHDAAVGLVDEITTATLAALGRSKETLPETVVARVALVREARAQLAVVIPTGGRSQSSADPAVDVAVKPTHGAFKSR